MPGVLGSINAVFSQRSLNVSAQQLQTDGELGYVLVDVDQRPDDHAAVLAALCAIDGTIRARALD